MADINEVSEKRSFARKLLKAGDIINGNVLVSDENFWKYTESDDSIRIKKLDSELTAQDQTDLLEGAKLTHIDTMGIYFNDFLEDGFEYPTSSGDYYSINESARGYLANLKLSATQSLLSYPVTYNGIENASISLANITDVTNLYVAALTAHETERQTRELPAITAIKAATTIDQVFAINY